MQIFWTLIVISGGLFSTGMCIEYANQVTTGYSDDGLTRHYIIPKGKRRLANLFMYLSGVLFFIDLLILIWS